MSLSTGRRFVSFGDFRLDMDRVRLVRGSEPLAVPPRALDTLVALVARRDRVVTKEELLELVWADAAVEEANLTQQVFTLRRILGDDPEHPRFIATFPRRGYRFIADVVEAADPAPARGGDAANGRALVPTQGETATTRQRNWRRRLQVAAWTAVTAAAGLALGSRLPSPGTAASARAVPVTLDVPLPRGVTLEPARGVAGVSPDGRRSAFVARRAQGPATLFVRDMDGGEARALEGTEGAASPFWSRDGGHLGYFSAGTLYTVSSDGGVPHQVCSAPDQRGGTWGADDVILFASGSRSVISRVAAAGGTPVAITRLDPDRRDISHRFPVFLPDGRRFLFLVWSGDVERQGIHIGDLHRAGITRLVPDASPPAWSLGRLFFIRRESLVAQPFDERTFTARGDAVTVAESVARGPSDDAPFAATASGAVTFVRSQFEARLVWLDRLGREVGQVGGAGQYESPVVSNDGRRLLFSYRDRARGNENFDVWVSDPRGGDRTRLTFAGAVDVEPTWSPDGQEVVFRSNRSGHSDLYRRRVDSVGTETLVLASTGRKDPSDWSPDGRMIVFTNELPDGSTDLWQLSLAGAAQPSPLVTGPGNQRNGHVSPDGRFLAYETDEDGSVEIFVRALDGGRRWRVAAGTQPAWTRRGGELMFLDETGLNVVAVTATGAGLSLSAPRRLFALDPPGVVRNAFAPSPDGSRILALVPVPPAEPPRLTVRLDWRP